MSKMHHLQFAEVRWSLGSLTTQPLGPLVLGALQKAMRDLRSLREHWFNPKPKPVRRAAPALVVIPLLPRPVARVVKAPEPVVKEEAPAYYKRSISTSTTYNTELTLPYRILWAKVIVRAAYDYALWRNSDDIRLRRFAEDAARWLFDSSDPDLELSFENICFAFDFPVEKIRKKTRTLTREDVKKLEFRERQGRSEILGEISGGDSK